MNLKASLDEKMGKGATFAELHEVLRAFARGGGTRADAELVIHDLRTQSRPEPEDDLLLDLLDVVTGFCQEGWRVWPQRASDSEQTGR